MVANKRAKGDGTIYQRQSDGMYCASIELPSLPGKRRRKVVVAKTEAQVKEKLKIAKRKLLLEGDIVTASMTLAAWTDQWFTNTALKKIKPRTAAGYRSQIEQYIKPAIGTVRLDKLTQAHVHRLHTYILDNGLSSTTARQAHRILSVILDYAIRAELITSNPTKKVDAPRKAQPGLTVLTPVNAVKVLQVDRSARLWTRWASALFLGARQGELLGFELDRYRDGVLDLSWQLQRISWEHGCKNTCGLLPSKCPEKTITKPVDSEHRYLEGGYWLSRPKSEAGWRMAPLPAVLRGPFEERIIMAQSEPNPHGLLWTSDQKKSKGGNHDRLPLDGSPIDPSRDNKAWHELLKQAGVPDVRLHDARHSTASLLLEAGVPEAIIMRILGHSSYVVTRGYQTVDIRQLANAMDGAAALLPLESVPPVRG